MKKVQFKHNVKLKREYKWLLDKYTQIPDGDGYKAQNGTGFDGFCKNNETYEKMICSYGYFHQWGTEASPDDNIMWTVAIVEDVNGNIFIVDPVDIRFIPDDTRNEEYEIHRRRFGW